jgi:hypothetical protein
VTWITCAYQKQIYKAGASQTVRVADTLGPTGRRSRLYKVGLRNWQDPKVAPEVLEPVLQVSPNAPLAEQDTNFQGSPPTPLRARFESTRTRAAVQGNPITLHRAASAGSGWAWPTWESYYAVKRSWSVLDNAPV